MNQLNSRVAQFLYLYLYLYLFLFFYIFFKPTFNLHSVMLKQILSV